MMLRLKFKHPALMPASAYVVLACYLMDKDGAICLAPDCVTLEEFEANVAALHRSLNWVVSEARKRFRRKPEEPGRVLLWEIPL